MARVGIELRAELLKEQALARAQLATWAARLVSLGAAHSTLLPHNFHALVETGGQNMRRGE
jgi:hypothetical protein